MPAEAAVMVEAGPVAAVGMVPLVMVEEFMGITSRSGRAGGLRQ